jgi:hypothetical protein
LSAARRRRTVDLSPDLRHELLVHKAALALEMYAKVMERKREVGVRMDARPRR